MNRRHLLENFVDDPEAIMRKTKAKLKKVSSSTLQHKASTIKKIAEVSFGTCHRSSKPW